MKKPFVILVSIALLSVVALPRFKTGAQDNWIPVGTGVTYQEFILDDPMNHVYVARMERNNPGVILEGALAQGRLVNSRETVGGMVNRYNDAINFWGETADTAGSRNKVLVAINGSYIDTETWQVLSGVIQSGWYAKRFDDHLGEAGFGWTRGRVPFIGTCVKHYPFRQIIRYATGETQYIDGVNVPRSGDKIILYTPQYASNTYTDDGGVEVLVEMVKPAGIYPDPNGVKGYVRDIKIGAGSSFIPFDHVVLSAQGTAAVRLADNVDDGSEIQISQEITNYFEDEGCMNPLDISWTKTYTSLSGNWVYLMDGQERTFAGGNVRHPRTAIAFNDQYIFFIVVDGRDEDRSLGMTIPELAHFTRDVLGATWAVNQDGGGSSTMVVNGRVVNQPAVACYRVYLPSIANNDAPGQPAPPGDPDTPLASTACQRPVGNGIMMVELVPPEKSTKYRPGDRIVTSRIAGLYLGPGANYPAVFNVRYGMLGIILNPLNGLNGIFAKGSYWWKVEFGRQTGWIQDDAIYKSRVLKLPRLVPR